jgi:hypothetical protein
MPSPEKLNVAKPGDAGMFGIMDWQETTALLVVGATAAVFLWRMLRPRKALFTRDTHCGCPTSPHSARPPSVILRARKGGRAEITVRTG